MKKENSYTLIEVVVAIAIFFVIVSVPTGFFILSVRGQRKALISREIIDNSSYVLEYIGRALRMAQKDFDGSCIDVNLNYKNTSSRILGGTNYSGPGIKFENYQAPPVCQEFFLDLNDLRLKESKNGASPLPLTADDLEVATSTFQPSGQQQGDGLQPKVTILFEIQKKGQPGTKMKIQTTISQRNLDVTY